MINTKKSLVEGRNKSTRSTEYYVEKWFCLALKNAAWCSVSRRVLLLIRSRDFGAVQSSCFCDPVESHPGQVVYYVSK